MFEGEEVAISDEHGNNWMAYDVAIPINTTLDHRKWFFWTFSTTVTFYAYDI